MLKTNEKWGYTFTYRTDRTGTQHTCSENDALQAARKHAAALCVDVASICCSKKEK
jgi:hypothetical protein